MEKEFHQLTHEVMLSINTQFDDYPLWEWVKRKLIEARNETIRECASIAEKYEPGEKQSYINYASTDIRKLEKK